MFSNLLEIYPTDSWTGALLSYKENWVPSHAVESFKSSAVYEAGGNLAWVTLDQAPPLPVDPFTVGELRRIADIAFPQSSAAWWHSKKP